MNKDLFLAAVFEFVDLVDSGAAFGDHPVEDPWEAIRDIRILQDKDGNMRIVTGVSAPIDDQTIVVDIDNPDAPLEEQCG